MSTDSDAMNQRIVEWLDRPWHSFGDEFYICACSDGLHMPVQWVTKTAGFGTQRQARDRIIADHKAAAAAREAVEALRDTAGTLVATLGTMVPCDDDHEVVANALGLAEELHAAALEALEKQS